MLLAPKPSAVPEGRRRFRHFPLHRVEGLRHRPEGLRPVPGDVRGPGAGGPELPVERIPAALPEPRRRVPEGLGRSHGPSLRTGQTPVAAMIGQVGPDQVHLWVRHAEGGELHGTMTNRPEYRTVEDIMAGDEEQGRRTAARRVPSRSPTASRSSSGSRSTWPSSCPTAGPRNSAGPIPRGGSGTSGSEDGGGGPRPGRPHAGRPRRSDQGLLRREGSVAGRARPPGRTPAPARTGGGATGGCNPAARAASSVARSSSPRSSSAGTGRISTRAIIP